MRRRLWLPALLLGALLFAPSWAEPQLEDPIVVRLVERRDGGRIYARNRTGADMTITLEFTRQNNVVAAPALPRTVTVPGRSEIEVTDVRQANPRETWSYAYYTHWNYGSMEARHNDSVLYRLPYESGSSYRINQGFHGKFSHTGDDEYAIDFGCPEGTPVLACRPGVVASVEERWSRGGTTDYFRKRVNCLRIRHDDGTIGEYDHFRRDGIVVEEGDRIQAGQLVGYSGNTGFTSGAHLHFVVYRGQDGRRRQSFPIRFDLGRGRGVELEQGRVYRAP